MPTRGAPGNAFLPLVSTAHWGGRVTRAEVNLDAIEQNARSFSLLCGPAEMMAVVKADAYGHGAAWAAGAALAGGASRLAVYSVEEGVVLRRRGIDAPILVFGPFTRGEARTISHHELTPTLGSLESVKVLDEEADHPVRAHVKIDSGLHRWGISPDDAPAMARDLRSRPHVHLEGIFTHLARADESDKRHSTDQLRSFDLAAGVFAEAGYDSLLKHVANSAAALSLPAAHFDIVRIGISLYGYYPSSEVSREMHLIPALSLLSTLTRVHSVSRGTGVGYGHEFVSARDSVLGLCPIGYGDGLDRRLGLGVGKVLIRGQRAPIVGRVSMDQIILDVTDVPGASAGDTVTLIGQDGSIEQSAEEIAAQAGTISYDVLTALLPRVPRVYIRGSSVVGTRTLLGDTPSSGATIE